MISYAYKGVDSRGAKIEGQVNAASLDEAEKKLYIQDISIHVLVPADGAKGFKKVEFVDTRSKFIKKKVSAQDSADILSNLAIMAETGVPFVEALDAVIYSARTPVIRDSLMAVRDGVVGGQGLSQSLRMAPNMFPAIITDMVRVAETGGKFDQALRNGANYLGRVADLRKKIMNAMMYPCVMLGVSIITILVLIVFVMPRFGQVFSQMKSNLPATTKLMLESGNYIRSNPIGALLIVGGVVAGVMFLLRIDAVKAVMIKMLNRVPVLGDLLKRLAIARSLQTIAALSTSNVQLLSALEQGARVAGHPDITKALLNARDSIEHGSSMYEAIEKTKAFPKQITQMIAVGEKTGRLSQLLEVICSSMEKEIDAKLKALVSIIEPLMIVSMGVIVGSITVSIISPIYSVIENIK
jgi:type IV pilus assembly protein PilC